jgi:hypothetical protein
VSDEGSVDGRVRPEGSPRGTWPAGLRALFWASGVGLLIEAAQLYWFGIVRGELSPPPSLQGMSALVGFTLGVVIVASGFWSKRRALVLVAYAKAVLWLFVTGVFFASTFGEWLADGLSPAVVADELPAIAWNLAVVATAVVVLWYLVSSQLVVADEEARSEISPLPPPVAVDVAPGTKSRDWR